jgi:hypothetical protein
MPTTQQLPGAVKPGTIVKGKKKMVKGKGKKKFNLAKNKAAFNKARMSLAKGK